MYRERKRERERERESNLSKSFHVNIGILSKTALPIVPVFSRCFTNKLTEYTDFQQAVSRM